MRGRPAQLLLAKYAHVLRRVVRAADNWPINTSSSSTNKQQLLFKLECGKHLRQLQLRTCVRSAQLAAQECGSGPGSGHACVPCLECRLCAGRASAHEQRFFGMLAQCYPDLEPLLEAWVHGRTADALLSGMRLAVMVDGEQHFQQGKRAQGASDAAYDDAVMVGRGRQIKGLLRLHFADTGAWRRPRMRGRAP